MSKILEEVLNANKSYAAAFGEKGKLSMPPGSPLCHLNLHGRPA